MILVTGASGVLGASLVDTAVRQGHDVVGLYRQHAITLHGVRFLGVDLTDAVAVDNVFRSLRPSAVIHCAAETNVDWCEEHPQEARAINMAASETIAEIAAQNGTYLLYVSTDAVFDGTRGDYAENDMPAPVNVYGLTKLQGEQAVQAQHASAGIARVTMYGWNVQNKLNLAEWVLEQLRAGKAVPGFTDVVFCPILANDLSEILLAMVEGKVAGTFHVVGSEAISKYEFARRVALVFDLNPSMVFPSQVSHAPLKARRPKNTSLSTNKIRATLDRPMPSVDSGLERFVQLRAEGYVERLRGQAMTRVRP